MIELHWRFHVIRTTTMFSKPSIVIALVLAANIAFAGEHDLGSGFEPVVSADRVTASNDFTKRVQVVNRLWIPPPTTSSPQSS